MRWNVSDQAPIPLGATRIVRRFLLWPKAMSGKSRWLEIAYIEQRQLRVEVPSYEFSAAYENKWVGERWATKREYEAFKQTRDRFRPPPAGANEKDYWRPRYDASKLVAYLKGEPVDDLDSKSHA